MSDIDGAAAPAESAPAPELPIDTPNPVSTEDQGHPEPDAKPEGKPEAKADKPEKADKPLTTREALQKARDTVEKESKAAEVKEKPADKSAQKTPSEVKTEPKRDPEGKFAPKEGDKPALKVEPVKTNGAKPPLPSHTAGEAPARFSQDAKAAWATAPESVRAEVSRMERELTQGFEKHKAAAERDGQLAEFHEMAKASGKELPNVVREYVNMENYLRRDLVGGLDQICQKVGVSLREVAAHVMGQTPEQTASVQDATIRDLKTENANLAERLARLEGSVTQQQTTVVSKEVAEFQAAHPRFDELADDITFFLKTRCPGNLPEAYKLAERLNPAPAEASKPDASAAAALDLSAQTEKGSKSIAGSPTPGSSPASQRPSNSIKESLKRAMAQAG